MIRNLTAMFGACVLTAVSAALYFVPTPAGMWTSLGLGCLALCALLFRPESARKIVARIKGYTWDRHTFCQHFLITGATGSGKTLSGVLRLLCEIFKREPGFGGFFVDMKGVLHAPVIEMATHFGRGRDIILLEVEPHAAPTGWQPKHRYNMVGDRSIPFSTYARAIVDTAVAVGNRQEQSFFRRAAQIHIGKALEALDAAGLDVTLENAYNMLVNPPDTQRVIRQLETREAALPLAQHFRNYLAQPPEQLAGVVGTVMNYLECFTKPAIAEVFCRDSTFSLDDLDRGKILCLALPQLYQTERRFVGTFLKLLFYTHALRRFDMTREERDRKNLLVLLADECQHFVSTSEDGVSDHAVVDVLREAGVSVIAATQSTTSLIPVLGEAQAKVFTLNLRNRLIFTAADEDDAKASADYLGKVTKRQKTVTTKDGHRSETTEERESYRIAPDKLRALPKHRCILVHCDKGYRKVLLPPLEPDGTVARWFRRFRIFD